MWWPFGDGTVATKQNAPLPWLDKRGKQVRVEEVTMVELLVRSIGEWCGDGSEWARWSSDDGAAALCFALLWHGQERSEARE